MEEIFALSATFSGGQPAARKVEIRSSHESEKPGYATLTT
jgi:hypothetical protein